MSYRQEERSKAVQSQLKQLQQALAEKRLVKVISGIDNFDLDRVGQVVRAATCAGAGAVDVAARPEVVGYVRQLTSLPVFASSVSPQALAEAVTHGADAVEIGNFDALYKEGFYLTAEEVIRLTEQTLSLLPPGTFRSVTVPGHLSVEAQVKLAQQLEKLGVHLLQTEGASRVVSVNREVQRMSAEEKARLTLENTRTLAASVNIPVMTASGIDAGNVVEAFDAGAAAVGIGSAVNRLAGEQKMVAALQIILAAVENRQIAGVVKAS